MECLHFTQKIKNKIKRSPSGKKYNWQQSQNTQEIQTTDTCAYNSVWEHTVHGGCLDCKGLTFPLQTTYIFPLSKHRKCQNMGHEFSYRRSEQWFKLYICPAGWDKANLLGTNAHRGREREGERARGWRWDVLGGLEGGGGHRRAPHIVSSFWTPHRVSALFTSCFSSSGFSVMWITSVRPLLPRTEGTLRKTSSFTPCKPWKARADGRERRVRPAARGKGGGASSWPHLDQRGHGVHFV